MIKGRGLWLGAASLLGLSMVVYPLSVSAQTRSATAFKQYVNAKAHYTVTYPTNGRWYQAASLHTGRMNATATLLPGGAVLVTGGENTASQPLASAEVYGFSWSADAPPAG